MSILTTFTRMWLTRTWKPFLFTKEYDKKLSFQDTENLGLYIHIPFCRSICSFCPYCKVPYEKEALDCYVDSLIKEIHMVGRMNAGKKKVSSLYFGGGTPALAIERLGEIIQAINCHFIITDGIGLELHPGDVVPKVLLKLKELGITKISIGIQSFQDKFLKLLGRGKTDYSRMFEALQQVSFQTVSMDFIFALPEQQFRDLRRDMETAFANGANHIAIYPFIDFTFTNSRIPAMGKNQKRRLLNQITAYCDKKGYYRDSIWTFSKNKKAKYSSMTRDNFLGFGCSATTLLKDQFKINTFSLEQYHRRLEGGRLPTSLTLRFSKRQRMVYYLFWTAYTTRVSAAAFRKFFGVSLKKKYGLELFLAKKAGFLTEKNGIYQMTPKGAFYYHHYEQYYTLSYIDKMWGIMRKTAFPEKISF